MKWLNLGLFNFLFSDLEMQNPIIYEIVIHKQLQTFPYGYKK